MKSKIAPAGAMELSFSSEDNSILSQYVIPVAEEEMRDYALPLRYSCALCGNFIQDDPHNPHKCGPKVRR